MSDADHHDHHDHLSVTTTDSGVHGEHGHMHDHSMSAHMMNHVMSFHFGTSETVLFDFWKFSSVGGLVGSMIGIFILAVLYEGLKYYREHLFWRSYSLLQYRSVPIPGDKTPLPSEAKVSHICPDVTQRNSPLMFSKSHGYQTFLHIIQIVISYFLMLIFMTYNVWLALAVAFGSTTGFFLFGWKKSVVVDVTEHCH